MLSSSPEFELIHKIVLHKLTCIKYIQCIYGIGSYFTKQNKTPNDLDYYIKFNKKFQDLNLKQISKILEDIKDKYKNEKSETLINIFIEDDKGAKLNSVDLWFILNYKDETLRNCITNRKNQIWKSSSSPDLCK